MYFLYIGYFVYLIKVKHAVYPVDFMEKPMGFSSHHFVVNSYQVWRIDNLENHF